MCVVLGEHGGVSVGRQLAVMGWLAGRNALNAGGWWRLWAGRRSAMLDQHELPLPAGRGGWETVQDGRGRSLVLLVGDDAGVVEADLAAGALACPGCGGPLARWGWARRRSIRLLGGSEASLRPRRSWCAACRAGHVLVPTWSVPRHRDATEVITAALVAKAKGAGHRAIAAGLGRPAATVRGWLRRATPRAEALRVAATIWLHDLDGSAVPGRPTPTLLGDGVDTLGQARAAAVRAFGPEGVVGVHALVPRLLAPDG